MIDLALAGALREAGLVWNPAPGDRFVLPDRQMDDDVFVISDMTVDVHEFPSGREIGFNGTTEWALDSVGQGEALWLPSEDQLRSALGEAFHVLEHRPDGYVVTVSVAGHSSRHRDERAENAYGRALLSLLRDAG